MPKAWLGILPKIFTSLKKKDKATFFSPAKWVLPSASARESEEREFVVDSGASMHVVSETDLNSAELETMRTSRSPTTVMTANGEERTNKEATVYVEQLGLFVNRYSENPVPERSGSTSGELRGDPLHGTTETETPPPKKRESKEVQRDISHEVLDWLQEFREILVDEITSTEPWGNPEQRSQDTSKSSHELPMEPRAKVELGSGEHTMYTHFPKDPNCDICLKTKITRASCRRRADAVVFRAEISEI